MKEIWKYDFGYAFFRPYIQWAARTSYSHISVEGLENVPDCTENAVLFASNHTNTLMDALVVLQSRKEPTAYVARADIFKNPFIARILTNLRILPIYRRRDGVDTKEINGEIFDNVVECINHGMALSIFPEGTHRPRRSLLPIKKGIFRMAQLSAVKHPQKPVYIVPAGIEYEDFFNNMCSVRIRYGSPIRVLGGEDLDGMAAVLKESLSSLFTYFPDDDRLDEAEAAYEASRRPSFGFRHWLLAVLLLPFMLFFGFLCCPMLLAAAWIKRKLRDKAWMNTVRFCCKLFFTPFTVAGALIAGLVHLPWYLAVVLALCTLYAHPAFYSILVFYKRLFNGR